MQADSGTRGPGSEGWGAPAGTRREAGWIPAFIVEATGDDDALADAIERDGRARTAEGSVVTMGRYLRAVADLGSRQVPLDAAIDVVIRSALASGAGLDEAIGEIVTSYPELSRAVRECVQLNALLPTTPPMHGPSRPAGPRVGEGLGPEEGDGSPRYRILSEIGSGSYGTVYRAADRRLGDAESPAEVAIKVLGSARWDEGRVLDEAVKARRVDHPNIVRVIDCGRDRRYGTYIVYEVVDGGDLAGRLGAQKGTVPAREAAALTAAIARGIHAAHTAGLIHMDLKPSNVLLTREGAPKVADFGNALRLSQHERREAEGRERPNLRGNIAYLAPEQLKDPSAASTAVDVYALGGILLTLLVGDVPLGYGLDPAEVAGVERRLGGFPRALRRIVARAMSPEPAARHESAAALAEDLEHWLADRPIAWQRPGALGRVRLWARRRPAVAWLTAVTVAAGAVGAGVGWHFYLQAVTQRAQKEALQQSQQNMRVAAAFFLGNVPTEKAGELDSSLLSQTILIDWLYGPRMLDEPYRLVKSWGARLKSTRAYLEEARAKGRENEVSTLTWQLTYGLWLVQDGDAAEATAELTDNRKRWEAMRPGDSILSRIDDLLACARCREAWGGAAKPGVDAERDGRLREAAAELRGRAERYFAELGTSPIHLTMLWTLRDAYEKYGLGDKAGVKWVTKEFARYPGVASSRAPRVPEGPRGKGT